MWAFLLVTEYYVFAIRRKKTCFPEFDLNDSSSKPVLSGAWTIKTTVFTTPLQFEIHLASYNKYK